MVTWSIQDENDFKNPSLIRGALHTPRNTDNFFLSDIHPKASLDETKRKSVYEVCIIVYAF